jgi:hypothetical protein
MRQAGPNGCAYVNEVSGGDLHWFSLQRALHLLDFMLQDDPYQENWQDHFWGTQYPTLRETRRAWDPNGVFYSVSTPGTEDWEVIDYGTKLRKKL